ncbi:Arc family DNA-binding protein [Pectobacterium versatile]|uniref:Arc family DNA-binding protein n=1 Tax=Pectobacterium versatile TaxID=2488639 RepID=UPI001F421E9B|nr:Arc family DNA-binding protein [Pectobacterium versatile]
MAKVQIRSFPDDLFEQMQELAAFNERSLEGQARFMLAHALNSVSSDYNSLRLPEWMQEAIEQKAKEGFRQVQDEIYMRLTQSLAAEGITEPDGCSRATKK